MNILWFVRSTEPVNNQLYSRFASVRLRALLPAAAIRQAHQEVRVMFCSLDHNASLPEAALDSADVVVFGKMLEHYETLYVELKNRGKVIVVDICDDVFSLPHLQDVYTTLLRYADYLICASDALGECAKKNSHLPIYIIPDCIESLSVPVKPLGQNINELQLLWFGHPTHLKQSVTPMILDLENIDHPQIRLHFCTLDNDFVAEWVQEVLPQLPPNVLMTFHPWEVATVQTLFARCDIVVVPTLATPQYQVKTANRVVESIKSGCYVVAQPIPSYQEFADFIELNASISAGVNRVLAEPSSYSQRLAAGQGYLREHYDTEKLAEQWWRALTEMVAQGKQVDNLNAAVIRLNLGCGDKSLPGYINVDVVDERAGNAPDVICDVRNLAVFADDYADEILTVHVIEHFYYWEVAAIVQEWVRVLKPGGVLVIECPNLLSACEAIINDPINATKPDQQGQRSMWALYGDPAWQDPLMCHRWLYTPQSLAALLSEVGLVNIRQAPAEYKLREPRDMRLCAEKPSECLIKAASNND